MLWLQNFCNYKRSAIVHQASCLVQDRDSYGGTDTTPVHYVHQPDPICEPANLIQSIQCKMHLSRAHSQDVCPVLSVLT